MKNILKRLTAVILMTAVFMVMSFAMTSEETFAASKVPAKPKITKAAVVNNNTVNLKWSKAKNAVKYKVYRKKADGKYVLVKTTAKRSYQNKKLAYGTKYTYKVTAISKAGKKNTSKIKVVFTKPAKPVISSAEVVEANTVKLTWKKAKGAVKYKVYRKKADGKFAALKTVTTRSYSDKDLAYDTRYTYKVKAVSKAGKTMESKVKAVTTDKKPVVQEPSVPETPVTPSEPAVPSVPETPAEPQQPAERTVTVRVPVYETDTVYWIKYNGEIIFKTTDPQKFTDKQTEFWSQAMQITHGQNGAGPEYQIIVGWDEFTMTESEFYAGTAIQDRIAAGEEITVTWND